MSSNPVIDAARKTFETNKHWADLAISQVTDDKLRQRLHQETNSIIVVMKHVSGNLQSRWTNFLTEDGEKEWRNRDDEFIDTFGSREEGVTYWEKGWDCLFQSLQQLKDADLGRTVTIRGEEHSVPLALQRSLGHTCYHVGQIILMSRMSCGPEWEVLTIPRGQSGDYNSRVWGAESYKSIAQNTDSENQ